MANSPIGPADQEITYLEVRFLGCRVVHPEDDLAEVVTS